ncbi:MAG: hypothetical protein M3N23_10220, partial [Pseudomonadota bacterium]|nr:hypothetical protein [Pseudomonadota bacterium]
MNLANGLQAYITEDVAIGQAGNGRLSFLRQWASGAVRNTLGPAQGNYLGLYLSAVGSTWTASIWTAKGMKGETFTQSGSTFTSQLGDGSTLVASGSTWILTLGDGTRFVYGYTTLNTGDTAKALVSEIDYTNGETVTISYNRVRYCRNDAYWNGDTCTNSVYSYAIR